MKGNSHTQSSGQTIQREEAHYAEVQGKTCLWSTLGGDARTGPWGDVFRLLQGQAEADPAGTAQREECKLEFQAHWKSWED